MRVGAVVPCQSRNHAKSNHGTKKFTPRSHRHGGACGTSSMSFLMARGFTPTCVRETLEPAEAAPAHPTLKRILYGLLWSKASSALRVA